VAAAVSPSVAAVVSPSVSPSVAAAVSPPVVDVDVVEPVSAVAPVSDPVPSSLEHADRLAAAIMARLRNEIFIISVM
jgi:hypothetical protein